MIQPDQQEQHTYAIHGIQVAFGAEDACVDISAGIEAQYPAHLVLIQSGNFLRGYNRNAYALHQLKSYRLMLAGTTAKPHLQAGFPLANHKKRLWPLLHDLGIPYVVALGNHDSGYTLHASSAPAGNSDVLAGTTDEIVWQVIEQLQAGKQLNQSTAKKLLAQPETAPFMLKEKAVDLDTALLGDILHLTRDQRTTWGESVRACMARFMHNVFAYGQADNKPQLLKKLSADIDLLKHYITQTKQLNAFKSKSFEHRVGLVVELGKIVGGLINKQVANHG